MFKSWKSDAIKVMKSHRWTEICVKSVDWNEFKKFYYDNGFSPEEAVLEEERLLI